jgi:hypothetical protein
MMILQESTTIFGRSPTIYSITIITMKPKPESATKETRIIHKKPTARIQSY